MNIHRHHLGIVIGLLSDEAKFISRHGKAIGNPMITWMYVEVYSKGAAP